MNTVIAIPETVLVWQFGGKLGNLRSQNQYSPNNGVDGYYMFSKSSNKYLDNVDTSVGISIDLTKERQRNPVWLMVPGGEERDILTSDTISFNLGGGKASVVNDDRTIGVNLNWENPPKVPPDHPLDPTQKQFQWQVFGTTGEKGKSITMDSPVALFNVNLGDFLIPGERVGGDIKFSKEGALPGWLSEIDAVVEFLMQ